MSEMVGSEYLRRLLHFVLTVHQDELTVILGGLGMLERPPCTC